ncbi:MAG: hypothetical protein COV36_07745, partial [Alphaproteobacteria bacterium CG11_big_fil_rev_8_21_14_0_20_44_7]
MKIFSIILIFLLSACAGGFSMNEPESEYYTDPDAFFEDLMVQMHYNDQQRALIEYGKQFLGAPYVYGGSSPEQGFDCSGFTQYIFAKSLHYRLPRSARQQNQVGKPVRYNDLQPGDLVFFDLSGRLSHVGIYLGAGKFFHASTGRKKIIIA